MRNKKIQIFLVLLTIITILIIGLISIESRFIRNIDQTYDVTPISYIDRSENSSVPKTISYPLSYPVPSDNNITLQRPSIDETNPWLKQYIILKNNQYSYQTISKNRIDIIEDSFSLSFNLEGETFYLPFITDAESKPINNNFLGKLYKIQSKDASEEINLKNETQRKFWIVYNNKLYSECSNVNNNQCADIFIKIPLKSGDKLPLSIFCGIDNLDNVKYCDDYIENIKIELIDNNSEPN